MSYQFAEGNSPSVSNSAKKLQRIALPASLTGKRVLDIGCNEGFFCGEAARRGAAEVIGMDIDAPALERAEHRFGGDRVKFLNQHWGQLPAGPFDLILWLSAMHYEYDPAAVISQIADRLTPNGLFVLECGVFNTNLSLLAPVARERDIPIYPTDLFLDKLLTSRFTYAVAAGAEVTPGDEVPRTVYHCRLVQTTVLIFTGGSTRGKSVASRLMAPAATKIIPLDTILSLVGRPMKQPTPLNALLSKADFGNLEPTYAAIDRRGLTEEYIRHVSRAIAASDRLAVIEGFMTDAQLAEFKRQMAGRAAVWVASRLD